MYIFILSFPFYPGEYANIMCFSRQISTTDRDLFCFMFNLKLQMIRALSVHSEAIYQLRAKTVGNTLICKFTLYLMSSVDFFVQIIIMLRKQSEILVLRKQ